MRGRFLFLHRPRFGISTAHISYTELPITDVVRFDQSPFFNRSIWDFLSQSSSTLSFPIWRWSSACTSSSSFSALLRRFEKGCGNYSSNFYRHWRIWLGWTPYSQVIWSDLGCGLLSSECLQGRFRLEDSVVAPAHVPCHVMPPSHIGQAKM